MGLLVRKKRSEESESLSDRAFDSFAVVLRYFGQYSFSIGEDSEFIRQADAIARHVLNAAPFKHATDGRRDWSMVQQFFKTRREQEVKFVNEKMASFKDVLKDVIVGLKNVSKGGAKAASTIENSLLELESAAEQNDIDRLRAVVKKTITDISSAVSEQSTQLHQQMRSLGNTLSSMREELAATKKKLEIDPLTKLNNRGAFDQTIEQYLELCLFSGQKLGVFMIDLDHFKMINDNYGHAIGDDVLVKAANTIALSFPRKNDFIARYGGEEFVVLLLDVDESQIKELAKRLLDAFRKIELHHVDPPLTITASLGYTHARSDDTVSSLMKRADDALYLAKNEGRDRACKG